MRKPAFFKVINGPRNCLQFEMNWKPVWMNQSPAGRDQRPAAIGVAVALIVRFSVRRGVRD